MSTPLLRLDRVYAWSNLVAAAHAAARGKRSRPTVVAFESYWADRLLDLQEALRGGTYTPGGYSHFFVREPKRRKISAAPFRDRVVHHALCRVIEPWFERRFIPDTYANRVGKGTHRAVDRLQQFARRHRYGLRLDIVKHFPSIDHALLLEEIGRAPIDVGIRDLCAAIVASGEGVLDDEAGPCYFPGDDLFALLRPRGLPIGNLTSQFWSNVYLNPLNPLDQFVKRELRCSAYLRYVDDMALFSDSKRELWEWKQAIVKHLARLRLRIHESSAQVTLVAGGVPWLGFVIFPTYRLLKARVGRKGRKRLAQRWADYKSGRITFAQLDASVQGWVNHLQQADTWGLRRNVFNRLPTVERPTPELPHEIRYGARW